MISCHYSLNIHGPSLFNMNDVNLMVLSWRWFHSDSMYTAPPEIGGPDYSEAYSYAGDVWSLGCCFYELLALRRPFNGDSLFELAHNMVHEPMLPLPIQYSEALRCLVRYVKRLKYINCGT